MFSVIMPVYNGEKHIKNAIESVISQTYKNWELIVINDGSNDNTFNVLKKYKDSKNIRIINQENSGVSVARNVGINNSIGKYIAFLDSDDTWKENHLETLEKMIKKYPDAGLYATFAQIHFENGKRINECNFFKDKNEIIYLEDFFEEYKKDKSVKMYAPSSMCVKRQIAIDIGGFKPGCKIGEDLAFCFIVSAYYPVVLTKKVTAIYEKANSTATKDVSFDPDWYFFDYVNKFYKDDIISQEKKNNIMETMNWFSMRRCRHYLILGKRNMARKVYKTVDKKDLTYKDKMITTALFYIPRAIICKIFSIRWRNIG